MKKIFYLVILIALSFTACDFKFGNKETGEEQSRNEQVSGNESTPAVTEEEKDSPEEGQEESAPEDINLHEFEDRLIAAFDEGIVSGLEDGMTYIKTIAEGKNFICTIAIDEHIFGNMTLKEAFEYVGMNEHVFAQVMKEEMQTNPTEEELELMDMLYQYQYNVIFRLQGEPSGEEMNCILGYEEFKR